MSENSIEVITVSDPRKLPARYIEYRHGDIAKAKAALLTDKLKEKKLRRYPDHVDTIYHFVSEMKKGWQIIAFDTTPKEKEVPSIIVEETNE